MKREATDHLAGDYLDLLGYRAAEARYVPKVSEAFQTIRQKQAEAKQRSKGRR